MCKRIVAQLQQKRSFLFNFMGSRFLFNHLYAKIVAIHFVISFIKNRLVKENGMRKNGNQKKTVMTFFCT